MCSDGVMIGTNKIGSIWAIQDNTKRPIDGRIKTGNYKKMRSK